MRFDNDVFIFKIWNGKKESRNIMTIYQAVIFAKIYNTFETWKRGPFASGCYEEPQEAN